MADSPPSPVPVRFLQPETRSARRTKLVGKGHLAFEAQSLVFTGRRMLPLWGQLLVVVVAVAAGMATLCGVGLLIALGIILFGRLPHRESLAAASVRSVTYEPRRHRFLVIADTGDDRLCVGWQTQGDSGALADTLRRQFPATFREERVRGWRTY